MSKKQIYIIGMGGSETDGVNILKVYGTKQQVKKYLVKLVDQDRSNDPDSWEYGTEKIKDVEEKPYGNLYAYGCYSDYHIDYQAVPDNGNVIELDA